LCLKSRSCWIIQTGTFWRDFLITSSKIHGNPSILLFKDHRGSNLGHVGSFKLEHFRGIS